LGEGVIAAQLHDPYALSDEEQMRLRMIEADFALLYPSEITEEQKGSTNHETSLAVLDEVRNDLSGAGKVRQPDEITDAHGKIVYSENTPEEVIERRNRLLGFIDGAKPEMAEMLQAVIPVIELVDIWPMIYEDAIKQIGELFALDEKKITSMRKFLYDNAVIDPVSIKVDKKRKARVAIDEETFLACAAVARMLIITTRDTPSGNIYWKGREPNQGIIAKTLHELGESKLGKTGVLYDPFYTEEIPISENFAAIAGYVTPDPELVAESETHMPLVFTRDELQRVYHALQGKGKIDIWLRDRIILAARIYDGSTSRPSDEFYERPGSFKKAAEVVLIDFARKQRI
jgi:hypothetical protein